MSRVVVQAALAFRELPLPEIGDDDGLLRVEAERAIDVLAGKIPGEEPIHIARVS